MSKIIFFLIATYFSLPALAQTKVESNLKFGMQVSGTGWTKSNGGGRCGRFSSSTNNPTVGPFNIESFAPNGVYKESKILKYSTSGEIVHGISKDQADLDYKNAMASWEAQLEELNKDKDDHNSKSRYNYLLGLRPQNAFSQINLDYVRVLRESTLKIDIVPKDRSTTVTLDIADIQQNTNYTVHHDSRCHHEWYNVVSSNDSVSGTVKIGYHMPKNVWAVIFKRETATGIWASKMISGFSGSLNQDLKASGMNSYIVWGKPDTDVYQEFVFPENSMSSSEGISGKFVMTIMPITYEEYSGKNIKQIISQIFEQTYTPNSFNEEIKLIKPMLYLHSNDALIAEAVNTLNTSDLLKLMQKLSEVSLNTDLSQYMWDVKAAATILAHQIALKFLGQLTPFCKDIAVQLPYSKENKNILGLKLANFYMEKVKSRVTKDTYIHFSTLLDLLLVYEKQGKTYAEIRNDKVEAKKILDAYRILTNTVDMRFSTLNAVFEEVNYVYKTFNAVGAPGKSNQLITDAVANLKNKDNEIYDQIVDRLRKFQPNNNEKVRISDIRSRLKILEKSQMDLARLLEENIKIVGGDAQKGTSFLTYMLLMMSNGVDVLTSHLTGSFEKFRSSYVDMNKVTNVTKPIQHCLDWKQI